MSGLPSATPFLALVVCLAMRGTAAFVPSSLGEALPAARSSVSTTSVLRSSPFFDDFEDFQMNDDGGGGNEKDRDESSDSDSEDEDEDEDEYADMDVAAFRSRMKSLFGDDAVSQDSASRTMPQGVADVDAVDELISFARSQQKDRADVAPKEWAEPVKQLEPGVVLLANPAKFCSDFGPGSAEPDSGLLAKFGLTLPPPKDLGPDRRADLLPVLMMVEQDILRGSRAVLLNRRTGYLLGDLEAAGDLTGDTEQAAPMLEKFCIQPLWFGGVDSISTGLSMLHKCPAVQGATKITQDGLYWGGDPKQAQEAMEDPSLEKPLSGFDFKFFVQASMWNPLMLQREIDQGNWYLAKVDKEVLFKSRDRMGTQRATPLWTEIMDLMGGEYKQIRDDFYSS